MPKRVVTYLTDAQLAALAEAGISNVSEYLRTLIVSDLQGRGVDAPADMPRRGRPSAKLDFNQLLGNPATMRLIELLRVIRLPRWRYDHRNVIARLGPMLDQLFPLPRLAVPNDAAVANLLLVLQAVGQVDDRLRIDQESQEWLAQALLANDWAWPMIRAMVVAKPA